MRPAGQTGSVRIRAVTVALVLLGAGCGAPAEPAKQAEQLHSIAAEGALLAHGAAQGGSTGPFTREHAKALRDLIAQLRPKLEDGHLAELAASIDEDLATLAADGDPGGVERRLEQQAAKAEELP